LCCVFKRIIFIDYRAEGKTPLIECQTDDKPEEKQGFTPVP
jgi:hypothetical protein